MMTDGWWGLDLLAAGLAWWLGLYLLARHQAGAQPRLAGLGLLAYALALTADLLRASGAPGGLADALGRLHWLLSLLPALFWSGALLWLLPEEAPWRRRLTRGWAYGLAPLTLLALALGAVGGVAPGGAVAGALALLVLAPLALGFGLVIRARGAPRPTPAVGLLLVATLFFTLGTGLLLGPLPWLPRAWVMLAIGLDLGALGLAIALLDAFEAGERLRPDLLRSLVASASLAAILGLPIALAAGSRPSAPLLAALLATLAVALALPVMADPLQTLLDRLVLAATPQVRQARELARVEASILPRVDTGLDLAGLDEAEFTRLTRRAFSAYGDLTRLAASPLTHLPIIDARLARRGATASSLERAAELKGLLAESVDRLKPRGQGDFGTGDEWRHYNALYFPYIAGLKPFSARLAPDELADPVAREALAWFREAVPERTLHNWQTAAARLVGRDLRERQAAPRER